MLGNVRVYAEVANDTRKQHGNWAKAAGAFRNPSAGRSRKSLIVCGWSTSLSVFRKQMFPEHD
jgi:hypothetical protein